MKLGIVGHAADKFTDETRTRAVLDILAAIERHRATLIVSGGCHLGGVDEWAEDLAAQLEIPTLIHKPRRLTWSGAGGFRERNLAIARDSDLVLCVVVRELPPEYAGMRFDGCYHCRGRNEPHVKSGGCWTAWKCKAREWAFV